MARRTKDAPGRVTPKGGPVRRTPRAETGRPPSGRYTAPVPVEYRSSRMWVPILMLAFFGLGLISILFNYLSGAGVTLLPGAPSNGYLFGGLGLIVLGFIVATRYR
jgi:Cell division protein CrgA